MVLQLTFNEFLRLHGAKGAAIQVLDGKVWITEDGRQGDRFLEAGRSYRVAGEGLVVVGAESRTCLARVEVRRPAPRILFPDQEIHGKLSGAGHAPRAAQSVRPRVAGHRPAPRRDRAPLLKAAAAVTASAVTAS